MYYVGKSIINTPIIKWEKIGNIPRVNFTSRLFSFVLWSILAVRCLGGDSQWTDCYPIFSYAIAVSPSNPNIIYVSGSHSEGGWSYLYRSMDGGNTWSFVTTFGDTIDCIAIDPYSSNTVFIGEPGRAILKSIDGCSTFYSSSSGVNSSITGDPIWIDPVNNNIMYAGGSFSKSTDYGQSWVLSTTAIGLQGLAIDPQNRQNLYGCTDDNYVSKSTNGGITWTFITTGLNENACCDFIAIDFNNPQTLYLSCYGSPSFFKSTNGGSLWVPMITGLDQTLVNNLLVDPSNTSTIYVATQGGVYQSLDGASTWAPFNNNLYSYAYNLGISLASPTTLFVTGAGINCYSFIRATGIPTETWQSLDSKIPDSSLPIEQKPIVNGNLTTKGNLFLDKNIQ